MKRSRKILLWAIILAVLVLAVFIILWTQLDQLVASAIRKYGSQTTQTAVSVSSVHIDLTSGKGSIDRLTVGNPRGFSSPYAIRLEGISTKIRTRSVTTDTIVIDEIRIKAPSLYYEMKSSGDSNLDLLKRNIKASGGRQKGSTARKSGGKEKRVMIRRLVIEKGRIELRHPAFEKAQVGTVRRIELTNIGSNGGATPAEIAEQILTPILQSTLTTVTEKYIQKEANSALRRLLGQ